MQVLSSDMATANARLRFFGFWRLIGEIGDLVSPALLGFLAHHAAYAVARSMTVFFALATKVFLTVSGKETVGRETV